MNWWNMKKKEDILKNDFNCKKSIVHVDIYADVNQYFGRSFFHHAHNEQCNGADVAKYRFWITLRNLFHMVFIFGALIHCCLKLSRYTYNLANKY